MDIVEAVFLGLIQGLTEFLPVSSSGHLELAKFFLGDTSLAEDSMMMTVLVHFATALSTIIVFWKDILLLLKGIFKPGMNEEKRFTLNILVSTIPAAAVGLLFEAQIESLFTKMIVFVSLMLIITGILLLFADRAKDTNRVVNLKSAIMIGAAQAIAILPGISRSGATISTSVLLGIDRTKAARFSFLMVVPLIFGKIILDVLSGDLQSNSLNYPSLVAGFVTALVTGFLACKWMILLVKNSKLRYFSFYCFIVAGFVLLYFYFIKG